MENDTIAGNAAVMREALLRCEALSHMPEIREQQFVKDMCGIITRALSAPARNCDAGTAEEQAKRFHSYCLNHSSECDVDMACCRCPLEKVKARCEFAWAQMPYEQEGAAK